MLEFNSRNIISGYIKQLLISTYLPCCKIFADENEMKKYFSNIHTDNNYLLSSESIVVIIKHYKENEDWFVKISQDLTLEPLMRYRYNHSYNNLTKKLKLNNDLYDNYTHRYLGDYLRFIRDYFNLNLMSLYNCFDNTVEIKNNKKYLIIPIKYNQSYSIFYSKDNITYYINSNYIDDELKLDVSSKLSKNSLSACFLISPINAKSEIINKGNDIIENKFINIFKEKNLRLIIEVDVSDNSPIVVLEGDYSNYKSSFSNIQINYEKDENKKYLFENNYNTIFKNNINNSNFQLVNKLKSSSENYPIADRLIEYLCGNVITDLDPLSKNIIDAKKKFSYRYQRNEKNELIINLKSINGKFNIMDRFKMLDAISMNKTYITNKQDLLGYIDKDVEAILDDERYPLKEVK